MNAQATRTADPARSWRLRPWPNDPATAHLVFLDHLTVPTEDTIATATARAKARGAKRVRTSALFPRAAEVVMAAGYHPVDTLALLRLDLTREPVRARPTLARSLVVDRPTLTRAMRRWHLRQAAAIDIDAFGHTWGNDVVSLREIRRATPVYRARVVGPRRHITGFVIAGAAGPNGYLQRLAVEPAVQRSGLGRALVTDAVDWMAGSGLSSVLVNTGIDNLPALALYERFGFRRLSEQLVIAEHRFAP